mgnify:CR=1 FL=1
MDMTELGARFSDLERRRGQTWDALWARRPLGRIAVSVTPAEKRQKQAAELCAAIKLAEAAPLPRGWTPKWRDLLRTDLSHVLTATELPGDGFAGLGVPRPFHGQSQGIADIFGARVEEQFDGNFFVFPLPPDPPAIAALRPRPLEESRYWGAVEYARYARRATGGLLPISAPVMTGPFDTANYLLGTTVLMEWVYTEPEALHALLATLTDTLARMLLALREAAGGQLDPALFWCLRGGPDICSECRAIVSAETYEQFEAPYLRELGRRTGPLGIHSCGSWERTVPSACRDPNIRAMNGGSREVDVGELCRLADGQMPLSIYRSQNVATHLLWPDKESFWTHILQTVPPSQPFEVQIGEDDIPAWNRLCAEHGRTESLVSVNA